jgi:hypothetical protein
MPYVFDNKNFLQLLCSSNKKMQKSMIENATPEQIRSICEIIKNLLLGNVQLSDDQLKKIGRKRSILRQILKKKQSLKKRKYLIQQGGFLAYLVPAIISGLATVLSKVLEK